MMLCKPVSSLITLGSHIIYRFLADVGVQASGCQVSPGAALSARRQGLFSGDGASEPVCVAGASSFFLACAALFLPADTSTGSGLLCDTASSVAVAVAVVFVFISVGGLSNRLGFASHRASASAARIFTRAWRCSSATCSSMLGGNSRWYRSHWCQAGGTLTSLRCVDRG
jgi:hypothetical protein